MLDVMDVQSRLGSDQDIEKLVELSLLAWEPVFASFRHVMGAAIFRIIYPDWHAIQRETVESYCTAREDRKVWYVKDL